MADIRMPSGYGGLLRYDEGYQSKLALKPQYVIIFVIMIILFSLGLKIFFPIA